MTDKFLEVKYAMLDWLGYDLFDIPQDAQLYFTESNTEKRPQLFERENERIKADHDGVQLICGPFVSCSQLWQTDAS